MSDIDRADGDKASPGNSAPGSAAEVECVIDLVDTDRGVIVDVSGEIDEATRDRLAQELLAAIGANDTVQVDLTRVSFMDSWGLSAVLAAHSEATKRGVTFEVSGASRQVAHLFVITGVAVDFGWPTFATNE